MAKLKVSELTRTANINGTDLVYVVQGVNSRATTVANLFLAANVIQAGPQGPQGPSGPQGEQGPAGSDASSSIQFVVSANNQANAYFFSGLPFLDDNLIPNPPLYFYRGFQYQIINADPDSHPLNIKNSANGNIFSSLGYNQDFATIEGIGNVQTIFFTVPMLAPSTLYYQSNSNPLFGNVIYVR